MKILAAPPQVPINCDVARWGAGIRNAKNYPFTRADPSGRDGNAYRRNQNGNWSKWENGSWNSVQRPDGGASPRDHLLNDQARQREGSGGAAR